MVITKRRRACCLALSAILLLGISPFAMAEEEGEGESYQTPSQITDEEIAEVLDAMYESGGAAGLYSSSSIHTETGIITFSGSDRYTTSALEACNA